MARSRRRRESTARRRVQGHARGGGFQGTVLSLPSGLSFWELTPGKHLIDVVPYTVSDRKFDDECQYAKAGELHYERTFFQYWGIGVNEKPYTAPGKTFGKPDPIAEHRKKESRKEDADPDYIKSLRPKERQLFLIWDHAEKEKGVQVLESAYSNFGEVLEERIEAGDDDDCWDQFYFPDKDGFTLRIFVKEETFMGRKFPKLSTVDFLDREEDLPEKIAKHGYCLDDLIVETPYEKLKAIFFAIDDESDSGGQEPKDESEAPKKSEPEPEPAKVPTASDFGLEEGHTVEYKDRMWKIVRVSGDGTSLTLMSDDEDGDVEKAIAPNEVAKPVGSDRAPQESEPEAVGVVSDGDVTIDRGETDDDDWDWPDE